MKILDITSHGNIPLELAPNPIAGIFSALVDEHLDGNVFICSKRLRIISVASSSATPSALCVFLQIFHVSWKMLLLKTRAKSVLYIYIYNNNFSIFHVMHRGSRKYMSRFPWKSYPSKKKRKEILFSLCIYIYTYIYYTQWMSSRRTMHGPLFKNR